MCPAPHSSGSRTSTTTAPFPSCFCTSAGSTSAIRVLIWRRTSAPDGLISENSSNALWIQYFREYSVGLARFNALVAARISLPPRGGSEAPTQKAGRPHKLLGAPWKDPIVLSSHP